MSTARRTAAASPIAPSPAVTAPVWTIRTGIRGGSEAKQGARRSDERRRSANGNGVGGRGHTTGQVHRSGRQHEVPVALCGTVFGEGIEVEELAD